jgi:hypothetical protein
MASRLVGFTSPTYYYIARDLVALIGEVHVVLLGRPVPLGPLGTLGHIPAHPFTTGMLLEMFQPKLALQTGLNYQQTDCK